MSYYHSELNKRTLCFKNIQIPNISDYFWLMPIAMPTNSDRFWPIRIEEEEAKRVSKILNSIVVVSLSTIKLCISCNKVLKIA